MRFEDDNGMVFESGIVTWYSHPNNELRITGVEFGGRGERGPGDTDPHILGPRLPVGFCAKPVVCRFPRNSDVNLKSKARDLRSRTITVEIRSRSEEWVSRYRDLGLRAVKKSSLRTADIDGNTKQVYTHTNNKGR